MCQNSCWPSARYGMAKKISTYKNPNQPTYEQCDTRLADRRFYASARWRKLRAIHIASEPCCRHCMAEGVVKVGEHVDHIVPRKVDPSRELDPTNLQTLCLVHHTIKSNCSRFTH
jgi:5-methylcytosine-specific restriction protein A